MRSTACTHLALKGVNPVTASPLSIPAFELVLAELADHATHAIPASFRQQLIELLGDRHDIAPGMPITPHYGAQHTAFIDRWQPISPRLTSLLGQLEKLTQLMDRDEFRLAISHIRQFNAPQPIAC